MPNKQMLCALDTAPPYAQPTWAVMASAVCKQAWCQRDVRRLGALAPFGRLACA